MHLVQPVCTRAGEGHKEQHEGALFLYGMAGFRQSVASVTAGSENRSAGLERAYLKYHNGLYGTGLNEGKLTKGDIEKTSGGISFQPQTIEEINTTLKNINDIATETGLTGTPGIIVLPVKGATAENITVFTGMTEAENIQSAINKSRH